MIKQFLNRLGCEFTENSDFRTLSVFFIGLDKREREARLHRPVEVALRKTFSSARILHERSYELEGGRRFADFSVEESGCTTRNFVVEVKHNFLSQARSVLGGELKWVFGAPPPKWDSEDCKVYCLHIISVPFDDKYTPSRYAFGKKRKLLFQAARNNGCIDKYVKEHYREAMNYAEGKLSRKLQIHGRDEFSCPLGGGRLFYIVSSLQDVCGPESEVRACLKTPFKGKCGA